MIANLLGNAIKFTPSGGDIEISCEQAGEEAKLSVSDSGPGIPFEYHEKIFDKFGQVEARETNAKWSTGLGLAFCKLAVAAQGGEIGVDSAPGEGSTFRFTLPLAANCDAKATEGS